MQKKVEMRTFMLMPLPHLYPWLVCVFVVVKWERSLIGYGFRIDSHRPVIIRLAFPIEMPLFDEHRGRVGAPTEVSFLRSVCIRRNIPMVSVRISLESQVDLDMTFVIFPDMN